MEHHDLGDERELRFTTTIAGTPTDPTELTFRIREPDGEVTEYVKDTHEQLEAVGTGIWRVLWTCRMSGVHHCRFDAGGNIIQTAELPFFVRRSKVLIPSHLLEAPVEP